jgi:hypothetical protein
MFTDTGRHPIEKAVRRYLLLYPVEAPERRLLVLPAVLQPEAENDIQGEDNHLLHMAIEDRHRREYLNLIAVRSGDLERESALLRYINRRSLLPRMTNIIVSDEMMYATAAQGEKRAGHRRTRVGDEMQIEEDVVGLKEALAMVPLYAHDSCMMNDRDIKDFRGGMRSESGNYSNHSELRIDRENGSMALSDIGGPAKSESSLAGGSNEGHRNMIEGRLDTLIAPDRSMAASTADIAELPVAVFRQIVRYIPFEKSKSKSFASVGIEMDAHRDGSEHGGPSIGIEMDAHRDGSEMDAHRDGIEMDAHRDGSEHGGPSTLKILKKSRQSISSLSPCALDGNKEISAEELEAINKFVMDRSKLVAFDCRTPTLCLDRLCCEGLVSLPSSSTGGIHKCTNFPMVVSIHILYGVLPVHVMAEANALKISSKCFRDRNQSHDDWQASVPLLSSTSSPAINESDSLLKTIHSDQRAVRLCPLNLLPNLQSGLTVHVYDHHSNVSNTLTLQGMTLGRLALFLGQKETLDDLSLMAEGILLHASSLLRISRVKINEKYVCTRVDLDSNSDKNSTKAGDELVTSPSQATGVRVSDLPADLSPATSDGNQHTREQVIDERVSARTTHLPYIPIASLAIHSNSSVRNGKSNYMVNPHSQKLKKAKALLEQDKLQTN